MNNEDIPIMVLEGAVAVGRVKCQQKPDDGHNEQGNVFLMNLFYKRKRSLFQFISFLPSSTLSLLILKSWGIQQS